ncbi:uncharacterized protein N7515_001174 [Penicillium bovifimosum]|uniref:Uncharacterized protein n=1 Tax=Penicillium bovifimosum TaxID=126998 RepID=A0A9W9HIX2_9EURO|nr:uncharacterized protein N7515_001174 [Penicillium bovifimosum]KAJ5146610.1 hypothetical protein N7515_001174 [Penicillium bovifimosum]
MATGLHICTPNLSAPLPLVQVPRHIRSVRASSNIPTGQANCYEPQPPSPQAGEMVGFHQNPDEYALANHTIGFTG